MAALSPSHASGVLETLAGRGGRGDLARWGNRQCGWRSIGGWTKAAGGI